MNFAGWFRNLEKRESVLTRCKMTLPIMLLLASGLSALQASEPSYRWGDEASGNREQIALPQGLPNPFTFSKTIVSGTPYSHVGDVIQYSLVISNTGSLVLLDIVINDPLLGFLDCDPLSSNGLQPGEAFSCAGSYQVSSADVAQGSVINTAFANVLSDDGTSFTATAFAEAEGPQPDPSLQLSKTIASGSPFAQIGDRIDFVLEVTNTGDVELLDVLVSDPHLEEIDCEEPASGAMVSSLEPGDDFSCTGHYLVAGDDLEAGQFVNRASVSAVTQQNETVTAQASATALRALGLAPQDQDFGEIEIGEPFTIVVSAQGGVPPYSFTVDELPEGFVADIGATEVSISGTSARAGLLEFPISIQDSSEPPLLEERTYFLLVNDDLEIRPVALRDATVNIRYFQPLEVINGVPPYRFVSEPIPPGLSQDINVLHGKPTEAGDFEISVIVTDAVGNVGEILYTLTVRPQVFDEAIPALPDGLLDVAYGRQLIALGTSGPVIWSSIGDLPPGLELQSTGFLSGVPRQAGLFEVSAQAIEPDGGSFSTVLPLTIAERGVGLHAPSLPPGAKGRDYFSPLTVIGRQPPFACQLADGALPAGVDLMVEQCRLTGNPVMPGTFHFELLATDADEPPASTTRSYRIRVAESDALAPEPGLADAPVVPVPVPTFALGRPPGDRVDQTLQQLAVDAFGNRYAVGHAWSGERFDIVLIKFDADGRLIWSQRFDSGGQDFGYGITVNPVDQGIYVVGFVLNGSTYEGLVLGYDALGVQRWQQRITGGVLLDALYGVAADQSGVYVVGERYDGRRFRGLYAGFSHDGEQLWLNERSSASTQTGYVAIADSCDAPSCPLLVGGAQGPALDQGWLMLIDRSTGAPLGERTLDQNAVLAAAPVEDGWIIGGDDAGQWRVDRIGNDLQTRWSVSLSGGEGLRELAADGTGFIYAAGRSGDDQALIGLISDQGQVIDSRALSSGARSRFTGLVVGPEGLVSVAGDSSGNEGNQLILFNLDTGKAF